MSILSKILYATIVTAGEFVEIKFDKYTKNAEEVNETILLKILKNNSKSRMGKNI